MELTRQIEYLEPVTGRAPKKSPEMPSALKWIRFGFGFGGRILPNKVANIAIRLFSTPHFRAKHRILDRLLEQVKKSEFYFENLKLKGYEWGSGDETVLLAHGWESRGTALRHFVPALLEKGFRVVAFDGPAHGDSQGKETTILRNGGAVRAAIEHFGGVYAIIAHSFGGASSVYGLGKIVPVLKVEKIVLLAVPDSIDKIMKDTVSLLNLPPLAGRRFLQKVEDLVGYPVEQLNVSNADSETICKEALLVYDKKDSVIDLPQGKNIFEKWDNASLVVTEGEGHSGLLRSKEVIGKVAEFIGG